MEVRKLRYFAQVVEARSLSRAAEQLNVAQPALSKSIQALERDLEAPLLLRSAQGVTPTEAGERLYEHCQIIFQQLDRARLDVLKTGDKPSGHVVVGMPYSILATVGLPLLKAVSERLSDVRLELSQEHSHHLTGRLRAHRVDFALMANPRSRADLILETLLSEELFFVENDERPAALPISFDEAAQHGYVLPGSANGLRIAAEAYFRARGLSLSVKHEVDAIGLIPRCVEAGLGATILPGGCLSQSEIGTKLSIRRLESGCQRAVVIARSASRPLGPAAAALLDLTVELCRTLVVTDRWRGASMPP